MNIQFIDQEFQNIWFIDRYKRGISALIRKLDLEIELKILKHIITLAMG